MTASTEFAPLAERMRPRTLDEVLGQSGLLAAGKPLRRALDAGRPYSMVLWGPPGCGKTTLARLVANASGADFQALSAVLAGVADVRAAVERARQVQAAGRRSILFVDEVHRFNKAQQDAFLPHLEDGTLMLIGATTENPSFALNSALLSRLRVHVLKALTNPDLVQLVERALTDRERGLGGRQLHLAAAQIERIAAAADGDVRRALTLLELAADQVDDDGLLADDDLNAVLGEGWRRFDKGGDLHFDQISALHKCIRSSNPDAALYWLCRMLDGGADPHFIARRLTRAASEDVGNADPRALELCLAAWHAFERLGSPEGELALAQATIYLACAARSNAVYVAYKAALANVQAGGTADVPEHLRNAPTKLSRDLGHGRTYVYDHDQPEGVAFAQTGFPECIGEQQWYQPVERGLETKIKEKLDWIRSRRNAAIAAGAKR